MGANQLDWGNLEPLIRTRIDREFVQKCKDSAATYNEPGHSNCMEFRFYLMALRSLLAFPSSSNGGQE